jgi:MFS superfamily sulfate permease-like transporter
MNSAETPTPKLNQKESPDGRFPACLKYLRSDLTSGFLVFLIALPLCLGISIASGFPPLAGIFTAIIGAVLTSLISNAELTIKGPAAGLIVIVLGCVQDFGGDGLSGGFSEQDMVAYQSALAVGVVAAVLQILFGAFRGGILGEFFPGAAVHGMLAAIGVIIMLKQIPEALGVSAKGKPFELLGNLPRYMLEANPAIATIGLTSLAIMFAWPWIGTKLAILKKIPAPLVVLSVAIPMGMFFDLLHDHDYAFANHQYPLGEQFLVKMPDKVFGMFDELAFPHFAALGTGKAWWWVFLFFAIGSLESMLSAKAVESLDPYRRKTNLNRDLLAVGTANLAASMVGGLPMISEIVRSRANIDNGAKTRYSNFWHGIFLLVCVALLPTFLHLIPLSALAAMLVYTGFRLAHPREFINIYRIGREQLIIFVVTIVAVLATDLLVGVLIGIALKIVIHMANGVPLSSIFKPFLEVEQLDEKHCLIRAHKSAIFSNWIPFRRQIEDLGLVQKQNLTIDLSDTKLVDHSTMEKLHEMQLLFAEEGLELNVVGLEVHKAVGAHTLAARRGGLVRMRRLTVIVDSELASRIESICDQPEISSITSIESHANHNHLSKRFTRIEVVASNSLCESIVSKIRSETQPTDPITVYTESIDVMRRAAEAI